MWLWPNEDIILPICLEVLRKNTTNLCHDSRYPCQIPTTYLPKEHTVLLMKHPLW